MTKTADFISVPDLHALESHVQWASAHKVYQKLVDAKYETYFAGGCVRDLLRGQPAKDLDLATKAEPEEILKLFPKTVAVGQQFGVIRVIEGSQNIEVATFRQDGDYKDGRRPESVTYADAENDAMRRDFTVNALFLDPQKRKVLDYVGGLQDLKTKTLRTVGSPDQRFAEDHLRILRALRFEAQLGFEIEDSTWKSLCHHISWLSDVSEERVREELLLLLISGGRQQGLEKLESSGALAVLFPLLAKASPQIWWRNVFSLGPWPCPSVRWVAFFWPLLARKISFEVLLTEAEKIRLTREDKRLLKVASDFLHHRNWDQIRWGEKVSFYFEGGGESLLQMQESVSSQKGKYLKPLEEHVNRLGFKQLPQPLLTGHDVLFLNGQRRGDALKEAYFLQLEGSLKDRSEALHWLQEKFKS